MLSPHHIAWRQMEAEKAFGRARRARRRRSLFGRSAALEVRDERSVISRRTTFPGTREIPLAAISGTFDAGRARQFDRAFGPVERTRRRWMSVWMAEQDLPPISVMQFGESFALLDGHHRVSVALARGDSTIAAIVT